MNLEKPTRSPILLLPLLAACTGEVAEAPTAPRTMSAAVRWVPARAPRAGALLEAPAKVVTEAPAAADVTVLHRGRVVRFRVAVGDTVRAGDPVADVQIPDLTEGAARLDALSTQIRAGQARLEALEALEREGLARAEQLFSLRSRLGALAAERGVAQAMLRTYGLSDRDAARIRRDGHVTLKSPVEGVVTARGARLGAVVSPGDPPLLVVEGPRVARIEASTTGPLPKNGEVDFIGQDGRVVPLRSTPLSSWADGHSGRTTVWLAPVEAAAMPDGLSGRVRVTPPEGAVEVPSAAIVRDDDGAALFVLKGEASERVAVDVLLDSGTSAIVRGAVAPGAKVAQDGARVAR